MRIKLPSPQNTHRHEAAIAPMEVKKLSVEWSVTNPATDEPINFYLEVESSWRTMPADYANLLEFAEITQQESQCRYNRKDIEDEF